MTTATNSIRSILDYPDIQEWVSGIEQAAGANAWVDVKIVRRNGVPYNVLVICDMKYAPPGEEKK
jgi:hypothetical protein